MRTLPALVILLTAATLSRAEVKVAVPLSRIFREHVAEPVCQLGLLQLLPVLRQWLGEWPDKVLFGTDSFDGGAEQGWEQVAWVGATTARRGLAMALTGMLRDGEVTRGRAQELAGPDGQSRLGLPL